MKGCKLTVTSPKQLELDNAEACLTIAVICTSYRHAVRLVYGASMQ
jgi:hypothetical protein